MKLPHRVGPHLIVAYGVQGDAAMAEKGAQVSTCVTYDKRAVLAMSFTAEPKYDSFTECRVPL